jgi:hypothetical protein
MVGFKEGDKSRAVCDTCKKIVSTTFRYSPYNYDGLIIPDILQGFCDVCGVVVSIPHQSSYKIKEFRERAKTVDL